MRQFHYLIFLLYSQSLLGYKVQGRSKNVGGLNLGLKYSAVPMINLGGTNYYFETNLLTSWYGSLELCRRSGLHLVSVETEEENALIRSHLQELGGSTGFWISCNDQALRDSYVWASTGRNLVFEDWDVGQPDHKFDTCENGIQTTQRAVYYSPGYNHRWDDGDPNSKKYCICEERSENNTFLPAKNDHDPTPLVSLGGTNYYFETSLRINWFAASEFCRRLGLYLIAVETRVENTLIKSHLHTLGTNFDFWTSGNDLSTRDVFVWSSTGQNVTFNDWGTEEPNHAGTCYGTERAVSFAGTENFRWRDSSPFTHEAHFICEQLT